MRFVVLPWVKKLSEVLFKNRKLVVELDQNGGYDAIVDLVPANFHCDGLSRCCRNLAENGDLEFVAKSRKVETVAEYVLSNAYGDGAIEIR